MEFITTTVSNALAATAASIIMLFIKPKIMKIISSITDEKPKISPNVTIKHLRDWRPLFRFLAFFCTIYLLLDSINSNEPLTRGDVFEIALYTGAVLILLMMPSQK